MLKTIRFALFLCLPLLGFKALAQQNIREGVIKYKEVKDPDTKETELSKMLGTASIDFYFSDKMFKMYSSSIVWYTTFKPSGNPEKGSIIYATVFDTKHFIEPKEEDYAWYIRGIDIGKFKRILYDKRDTKIILGYSCYRATLELENGSKQIYYITDKIKAPGYIHQGQTESIQGYPLEIHLLDENGISGLFRAVEILPNLPPGSFDLPTGIEKELLHKKPLKEVVKEKKVAKVSPDIFDHYMGFKLGSKKSDYPKKSFENYVRKELFGISNSDLAPFFENTVHRSYVVVEKNRIKEIFVELTRFKESDDEEVVAKMVNTILPEMIKTLGEPDDEKINEKGIVFIWKGKEIQVELTFDNDRYPTFLGGSLPYFKREIRLKALE